MDDHFFPPILGVLVPVKLFLLLNVVAVAVAVASAHLLLDSVQTQQFGENDVAVVEEEGFEEAP